MAAVTERIDQIEQPRAGGYLPLKMFERISFDDGIELSPQENISGKLIGPAVEYLTRFLCGKSEESVGRRFIEAFGVSLSGAAYAQEFFGQKNAVAAFQKILEDMVHSDTDGIITAALKLVTFDVWYCNPRNAVSFAYASVKPDADTIGNIYTMLRRSRRFFTEYSPVVKCGFDFAPNGYTLTVDKGDGDFLSADTLWDMKVYSPTTKITKRDTLQILMYWIMGQHSGQEIFRNITKIGFFNPRMNTAYDLDVSEIPAEIIREVEDKVICY